MLYRFSELSPEAKNRAVLDYIAGWEETHDRGDISREEAHSACFDTDYDVLYNVDGEIFNEGD